MTTDGDTVDLATALVGLAAEARRTGNEVDWIAVGDLAYRAWLGLRLETDATLARHQPTPEPDPTPEPGASVWRRILDSPFARRLDPDRAYTAIARDRDVIDLKIRRPPLPRRVTIAELVALLAEARQEAETRLTEEAAKERARSERHARRHAAAHVAHTEDLARDIATIRERLPPPGTAADLADLAPRTREGYVTALVATLQLSNNGEAHLEQAAPAEGPIRVRRS